MLADFFSVDFTAHVPRTVWFFFMRSGDEILNRSLYVATAVMPEKSGKLIRSYDVLT